MGTRARTTAAPEDSSEEERERVEAAEKHVPARKGVKEDPVVRDSMVFWDKEFIIRELLPETGRYCHHSNRGRAPRLRGLA